MTRKRMILNRPQVESFHKKMLGKELVTSEDYREKIDRESYREVDYGKQ